MLDSATKSRFDCIVYKKAGTETRATSHGRRHTSSRQVPHGCAGPPVAARYPRHAAYLLASTITTAVVGWYMSPVARRDQRMLSTSPVFWKTSTKSDAAFTAQLPGLDGSAAAVAAAACLGGGVGAMPIALSPFFLFLGLRNMSGSGEARELERAVSLGL
jgi:hypothetical protein